MLQPQSRLACSHPLQMMLAAVKASMLCTECPVPCAGDLSSGALVQSDQGILLPKTLLLVPYVSCYVQGGLAADQRDHSAQDIGVIASGAAYSQGIAEQADWLGSAKITLQVRKKNVNLWEVLHLGSASA